MRLLIFGATGGTGRELVHRALERGHSVTAFARDPAALDEREGLRALAGDVLDAAAVERAVAGHDAVLCTIGRPATSPGTLRSQGTHNIVRAMQTAGPTRLICQSTIGIGDSRALLPPLYRYLLVPTLLRRTFAEHRRQEACRLVAGQDPPATLRLAYETPAAPVVEARGAPSPCTSESLPGVGRHHRRTPCVHRGDYSSAASLRLACPVAGAGRIDSTP